MSDSEEYDPAVDFDADEEGEEEEEGVVAVESDDEDEGEIATGGERPVETIREVIVVAPHRRRTPNIISSFEMTELISIRATQISQFNNCMVDTNYDCPIKQAKLELMMRKSPLKIIRDVGERIVDGVLRPHVEHWYPNTMMFSVTYDV